MLHEVEVLTHAPLHQYWPEGHVDEEALLLQLLGQPFDPYEQPLGHFE